MRVPTEYLISHGWLLVPVSIIGILALYYGIFVISDYDLGGCHGFSYFSFIDQRADEGNYTIQLINGNMPVIIDSITAGTVMDPNPYVSLENVQPRNDFIIRTKPLGIASGNPFANTVVKINYEIINGAVNLTDTATCFGRVM